MKVRVKRTRYKAIRGAITFRIIISNICDIKNDGDVEACTDTTKIHEAAEEIYHRIMKFWLTADSAVKDKLIQSFNDMKEAIKDLPETDKAPTLGDLKIPTESSLGFPNLDFEIGRRYEDDKEIISIKFSPRTINVDIDRFLDTIKIGVIKVGLKYSVKIETESTGIDTWEPVNINFSDLASKLETVSNVNTNDAIDANLRPEFVFHANIEYVHEINVKHNHENENAEIAEVRNATDYFRKYVHDKLVGNPDYINSAIVLSDSLQYPEAFNDKEDGAETVEVIVGPESNTAPSTINRIIYEARKITEDIYTNIACTCGVSCDTSKINIAYPTNDLLTQSACVGFGRLVTMAYQTRHNKSVDDHARGECFERIHDSINTAYACGDNVIIIPNGFVRITDKKDDPYSDKKMDFLTNFIMATVFMNGGDFDYIPETLYIPDINEKEKQSWNNGWRF